MIKRTLMFLDGENLVARFQDMVKQGKTPHDDVVHEQDRYVWHPHFTRWSYLNVIRVSYYCVVSGDESAREKVEDALASFQYMCTDGQSQGTGHVVPKVYRKVSKERRTRLVDIQLTIDVLNAALHTDVDSILIASGDGDFAPLLEEVQRTGKQAYVAAFSSGLSPRLSARKDVFVDLNRIFFSN